MRILKKLWYSLLWIKAPLGAKIHISPEKPTRPMGKKFTIHGEYVTPYGKIYLWAKPNAKVEDILEVLDHEILHKILHKRISFFACQDLDNITKIENDHLVLKVTKKRTTKPLYLRKEYIL